jgi:hypothetical protein
MAETKGKRAADQKDIDTSAYLTTLRRPAPQRGPFLPEKPPGGAKTTEASETNEANAAN